MVAQRLGEGLRIHQHLPRIGLETVRCRSFEREGRCCHLVHVRSTLQTGKNRCVDGLGMFGFAQNEPAARPPQGFVCGGCHHVKPMVKRVVQNTTGNQSAHMRHICHGERTDLIRNRLKRGIIHLPRVRRVAADNELRALLPCSVGERGIINPALRPCRLVTHKPENTPHMADRRAMGQMSPMAEIHGKDRITRVQKPEIDGLVHRRAGQRLYICVFGTEEGCSPCPRQKLNLVCILLPAIIATARIAFCILVGKRRAEKRQHLGEAVIFGRNEFQPRTLPRFFTHKRGEYLRVTVGKVVSKLIEVHEGTLLSKPKNKRPASACRCICPGERL